VDFEAGDPFSLFGNNKNFTFCPETLPAHNWEIRANDRFDSSVIIFILWGGFEFGDCRFVFMFVIYCNLLLFSVI
jgi:hypothetical protein